MVTQYFMCIYKALTYIVFVKYEVSKGMVYLLVTIKNRSIVPVLIWLWQCQYKNKRAPIVKV